MNECDMFYDKYGVFHHGDTVMWLQESAKVSTTRRHVLLICLLISSVVVGISQHIVHKAEQRVASYFQSAPLDSMRQQYVNETLQKF